MLPVAVEMHAAHCGRVAVQRVDTLSALGVPHPQRPVGGAADHCGGHHLAAPHPAGVTRQRPQTLRKNSASNLDQNLNLKARPWWSDTEQDYKNWLTVSDFKVYTCLVMMIHRH